MTITRGEPWGQPGPLPEGAPTFADDRSLAVYCRARWPEPVVVGLLGGDLFACLGGVPGAPPRWLSGEAMHLPVDVVEVVLDGGTSDFFVAHLVARTTLWRGRSAVAAQADRLGEWVIGPRAHPNDALVDVTEGSLGWRQLLLARRRARNGTHLPHPDLQTRRSGELDLDLGRPVPIRLDGTVVGQARSLSLRVVPDALTIVI